MRQAPWIEAIVTVFLGFSLPVVVLSENYPQPVDKYVNDYAQVISQGEEREIRALFTKLEESQGIQGKVVTISSIQFYNTGDATIESFARNLFNTWKIGDKQRNTGVLLLVAVSDRKVRIELGKGFGSGYNKKMAEIIQENMIPSFKQSNYSQGIKKGVQAIVYTFEDKTPRNIPRNNSNALKDVKPANKYPQVAQRLENTSDTIASENPSSSGNWPLAIVIGVVGSAGVGIFLQHHLRHRKRHCPNCQTIMDRLEETADNLFLNPGQSLEEDLRSVDYDVWKCPSCATVKVVRYERWGADYSPCPICGYKTLEISQRTLIEPSYSNSGEALYSEKCLNCPYNCEKIIVLPMLTSSSESDSTTTSFSDSDSSSSSNDSGGSSDGGGASGDW